MATVVSHRDVSLAVTPPARVTDDQHSPHVTTWQIDDEKKSESPAANNNISEPQVHDDSKTDQDQVVGVGTPDEPTSRITAHLHLYESPGNQIACQNQDGQATPTGGLHRRTPSSSIPHLLSTSASFTSDPQQLIQQQMNLLAIGTNSPSPLRSREASFAFSVDGEDLAFKAVPNPYCRPQGNLMMNLKQGVASLEGCSSNLSSVSLASCVSPVGPPRPPDFALSPPKKVPTSEDLQASDEPKMPAPSEEKLNREMNANVGMHTTIISGTGATNGLPAGLPNQPFPNHHPMPSAVQPVLYSAINSLERYNANSFDNKVMLAKARGNYRQSAFPGVPMKNSELESKCIPGVLAVGQQKSSSIIDEAETKHQEGTGGTTTHSTDQIGHSNVQIGVERIVRTASHMSNSSGLVKSKSSGHLDDELNEATRKSKNNRSVTIDDERPAPRKGRKGKRRGKMMGVFRPSSDAYTPRVGNRAIKYKPAEERESVEKISSSMGTIQRPNFRDALRRVAIILHQHIVKIERRFSSGIRGVDDTGLFKTSMREQFNEENYATPRYKISMVRVPMARPGAVYSKRKIRVVHTTPTTDEIYEFAHQLFKKVQLSSECSIVCLIYVEKLMEVAKVPLVSETWRPIFMCGLLLASKVWQDLSSWNIEFACVYPQFSLDAINRLELFFLKSIKWDLYISSRYVLHILCWHVFLTVCQLTYNNCLAIVLMF